MIAAFPVSAGIIVQLLALYRSLELVDDQPARYAATGRYFLAGVVVVAVGVIIATIVA